MPSESQTVEQWAQAYVESDSLAYKCRPPAPPSLWAVDPIALDLRPGRPKELRLTREQPERIKLSDLSAADARARLMHKFWHHELQAAELMAWALLRFADAPHEFRRGLVGILRDEVRHMGLYQRYLEECGVQLGDFAVRDAFWDRVSSCSTPLAFVALLGMGFEGANLEHTRRFAARFIANADEEGARIHEQVGKEEVAHVRFATRWFAQWTGGVDFETWRQVLPAPLTPQHLRGKLLSVDQRRLAGMPDAFIESLSQWRKH